MARINRSTMFPSSQGTRRTTAIVNAVSTAGYTASTIDADPMAVASLSGALTANTLKTMLDITTTGGRMPFLAIASTDATARTLRIVLTVDGVPVYDVTSASFSANNTGACLAGKARNETSGRYNFSPDIVWTTSIKVEIASSLTETNKFTAYWMYNTEG
jgi:hypothetical protein